MRLQVRACAAHVGTLDHDRVRQHWSFDYSAEWLAREDRYPLSPALPLVRSTVPADEHSRAVRTFFENLLPEGQALDDAAAAMKVSKAETFGLIAALGRETAGALEIVAHAAATQPAAPVFRPVAQERLSERIRARPHEPFTVWDGRVRLSIAGYQDKLAVYEDTAGHWFLVDGSSVASTHLLKPEPLRNAFAGMTSNEHFCMRLADAVGLPAARTRLTKVPEPVLVIERFDRRRTGHSVERIHCIDGCQALGLPVAMKYERPYGSGSAVKDIRDGATLRTLFEMLRGNSPEPVADTQRLLRWTVFQALIGNVDAHAKNLSFFVSAAGLRLAPAYDLICGLVYTSIDADLAMAIGDEFSPRQLTAFDWARFAADCGLPPRLVARQLDVLASKASVIAADIAKAVVDEGADERAVGAVLDVILAQAQHLRKLAPQVPKVNPTLL